MYFGSGLPFAFIFSKGVLTFLVITFILAIWKVVDIIVWLFLHINITWS